MVKWVKINYLLEGQDKFIAGELIEENKQYILVRTRDGAEFRIYHSAIQRVREVVE
ncbi:MAG: hypothetical protein ACE5ES_05785 [Candidatus Nanoarchaeia archaeon]